MKPTEPAIAVDPDSQSGPATPPPRRRNYVRCGCMTAGALVLTLLLLLIAFRIGVRILLGPERLENLKKIDTEIVAVPPEWRKPQPLPSPEVLAFQEKFYNDVQQISDKYVDALLNNLTPPTTEPLFMRLRRGDEVTSAEQQTLDEFEKEFTPILSRVSVAAVMPNYTMDMNLYTSLSGFLQVQQFAKYASVAAMNRARRGDCMAAMYTAGLPLYYVKRSQPAPLITDLIANASTYITVSTMSALAGTCNDAAALERGLQTLDSMRGEIFSQDPDNAAVGDIAAIAGRAKALGYPITKEPQTRADWTALAKRLFGRDYNEWAIRHFPADDSRARAAKERLETIEKHGLFAVADQGPFEKFVLGQPGRWDLARLLTGISAGAYQTAIAQPNIEESATRTRVVQAAYDLTMLHFAERLAQLKAKPINPGQSGIAAYLETVPTDSFSGSPFKKSDSGIWYSIGPDKDDDNLKVIYDATNGTLSDGDVRLKY